ncbi:MAG TPA: ABC transporter ATP-binding protein [Acholeplasma sp.]|jgi:multidrug/hemolysin transport system ATP-binding protein
MDYILEVDGLYKTFGEIKAVDHISFKVKRGTLFAFLGQNGAGKSTTIKMIITLLQQDAGSYTINGSHDDTYIRKHIGVVFQENVCDNLLTVKENLLSRGVFYINDKKELYKRYKELVLKLNLQDIEHQPYKTLSGGQKRRVEIARALFANPELLLLDEPTTGLDPETRQIVWQVIDKLRKEDGITVFLTTHYMEEAANADDVVIIHKGKIVAQGTPSTLKNKYSKDYFRLVPKDETSLITYLEEHRRNYKKVADQYFVEISKTKDTIDLIIDLKDNIESFEVIKGTMDDVFINVIGEQHE